MRRNRSGNIMIEAIFFIPIVVLLLMGMVNLGRVAYIYFTLHKTLYTLASYLGTQQGVNFCDAADPTVTAAKTWAINGTSDTTAQPILASLTADMIQISVERSDATTQTVNGCDCTVSGCDTSVGGLAPDFIVVTIPDGYPFQFNIPLLPLDPIPLHPQIRMPYGGT
jgi:hypothetical protein